MRLFVFCDIILVLTVFLEASKQSPPFNRGSKKIAWIMPALGPGSGGLMTIIQNANALVNAGYSCDIYVRDTGIKTSRELKETIIRMYGQCLCPAYPGINFQGRTYDLVFATAAWNTVIPALKSGVEHKAYFIQDFEPWFDPVGLSYLNMERTYTLGLEGLSIGRWLAHKLSTEYNTSMHYFDFCADLNIYHRVETVKRESAVCFVFQPEKPRRCAELGLQALSIVKRKRPDVTIYLYGSNVDVRIPADMINLKLLNWKQSNDLYNRCLVGMSISSTNPSRIPFEMMAAGLPVVEVYRENNLYDMPEDGVLLAEPTPESMAGAVLSLLNNETLREEMAVNGASYMQKYPLEAGFQQVVNFVDSVINKNMTTQSDFKRIYYREAHKEYITFTEPHPVVLAKRSFTLWKIAIIAAVCLVVIIILVLRKPSKDD